MEPEEGRFMRNGWKKGPILLLAAVLLTVFLPGCKEKTGSAGEDDQPGFPVVMGYGLADPGAPPFYVPESVPEPLEEEEAAAWLMGAFYQEGYMGFKVLIQDRSQERTYSVRRKAQRASSKAWEGVYVEAEKRTFPPASVGEFREEPEENTQPYNVHTICGVCEAKGLDPKQGFEAEIRIGGFSRGFPVKFVPAGEVRAEENRILFADGGNCGDFLYAQVFSMEGEGTGRIPLEIRAEWENGTVRDGRMAEYGFHSSGRLAPSGLIPNTLSWWKWDEAPEEGTDGTAVSLTIGRTRIVQEEKVALSIPIPPEDGRVSEKTVSVKLGDGTLTFSGMKKRSDPYYCGIQDGEEQCVPAFDMEAAVLFPNGRRLTGIYGWKPATDGTETLYEHTDVRLFSAEKQGGAKEDSLWLTGLYEEGDQELFLERIGLVWEEDQDEKILLNGWKSI